MSIDLKKLENKLDEALSNETNETLTKFLTNKRMSNNKQSSIEYFKMKIVDIVEDYKDDIITLDEYIEQMKEVEEQAKAMHKEEMDKVVGDFWNEGASYVYDGQRKYNSFDDYYNETFGEEK